MSGGWLGCRPSLTLWPSVGAQRPTFLWARPQVSVGEAFLKSTNH